MNYDNYVALDWSQSNMAIARLTNNSEKAVIREMRSDVKELKVYLKSLKGSTILTFEESTPAKWLHAELSEFVDKI